jgi:PglZ domain
VTVEPNGNGPLPLANRAVIEGELRRALQRRKNSSAVAGKRLLLLRAAPEWREEEVFPVDLGDLGKGVVPVAVAGCPTVLSVLDAISRDRGPDAYLVVLTSCGDDVLGESIRSLAIAPSVLPVDRWDLIQAAFGTSRLEPTLTRKDNGWLAEALLDAQPVGGWRKVNGPVLSRDAAVRSLAAVRLRPSAGSSGTSARGADADEVGVDAAGMLEWTLDRSAVAGFRLLRPEERDGLITWLRTEVGPVAEVIFALADQSDLSDVIPLGLAFAALYTDAAHTGTGQRPDVLTARGRAVGRYFTGKPPGDAVLSAFGDAAESLVGRWIDNGKALVASDLCLRAEAVLADLGADTVAAESNVLDAGLDARLAGVLQAIGQALPRPTVATLEPAETAFRALAGHRRRRDRTDDIRTAMAALRVARWLATPPEDAPGSLGDAATRMLRSWGWADRALSIVSRADTSRVPGLAPVYDQLLSAGATRRAELNQAFAGRLVTWTAGSSTTDDLLLVENILERIGKPLAAKRLPLVLVLDGMSVAAACDLVDQITASGLWLEAGRRQDGREPALSTVPSITSIARASLLSGTLCTGSQAEENAGFASFWGNRKTRLFHKGELTAAPVKDLHRDVRDAILDPEIVVGVVLNTIDDMLDRGREGSLAYWDVERVTHLRAILDEARRAGRPVILTADHGHVLDRGTPSYPAQSGSARYRTGTPGDGEVVIGGPRVLTPGNTVVAAVDEGIHYQGRKAGYHGGASPAEVVVPVIVLVPSAATLPSGWYPYEPKGHAPAWWDASQPEPVAAVPSPVPPRHAERARAKAAAQKAEQEQPGDTLFGMAELDVPAEAAPEPSLGRQVVASGRLAAQRQFARRMPDDERIVALIDGLAAVGGKATIGETARIAGEPAVRMSGYIAQVSRLLNVDGYPVIRTADEGRTVELNTELLRQQFLGGEA